MAKKAYAALSGGVDSAAAAVLLLRQGFDVTGVTMSISGADGAGEAAKVAEALKIEHVVLDFTAEFKTLVIEPFVNEYLNGRTPNPCVLCNPRVKWGLLLEKALKLGADYVATGHYANIVDIKGRTSLKRADFTQKDQTYALYRLTQPQLQRTLFPLGAFSKGEAVKIASEAGLDFSGKPESQEICFIEDNDYHRFIRSHTGRNEEKGEFVLSDGTVLGVHNGISRYTIGQRKGLGVSYREPLFVRRLDRAENRVLLGSDADLYSREFTAENVNYMSVAEITEAADCYAKIRYAHKGALCRVMPSEKADRLFCRFYEPQRAITPGQSAVFYDNDGVVIAGGIIA